MNTGFDGNAYLNTATIDSPTWVELDVARDVNTGASANKVDVSDRRSKFTMYVPGMLDLETSLTLTYIRGGVVEQLRDKFLAREWVDVCFLDGPVGTTDSQGFRFAAHVFSNDFDQPLTDGQTVNVTFAPTIPADEPTARPSWHTEA